MRDINKIIIHCSASDNLSYGFDRIYKDHTLINKWSDIGYHFGIDYCGSIKILRDITKQGAHAKGHNEDSIGICVLGKLHFDYKQYVGLASLVSCLMKAFKLNADDVIGHNEVNENKTCPNFNLESWKLQYLEAKLCHWN